MNYEWIGKIRHKKSKKQKKIKVKCEHVPHVNKKPLARKRIFVQTTFSHPTLKLPKFTTITTPI